MINKIESTVMHLRRVKPVVLCLTNYVTMDFMANSLLASGAAPIMSCDENEIEELVKISHAININIGTLDSAFIKRCKKAIEFGNYYNKPMILDPVGAGASSMRTKSARELMGCMDIIRGNASEVMALLDDETQTLGVESAHAAKDAKNAASKLATNLDCTIVVSGAEDFITDGLLESSLAFGSSIMPLITGMGCALTAVIAAFRAVISDSFEASTLATAYFGLCGNLAHLKTNKPGTFRTSFIDELYSVDFDAMRKFYVR